MEETKKKVTKVKLQYRKNITNQCYFWPVGITNFSKHRLVKIIKKDKNNCTTTSNLSTNCICALVNLDLYVRNLVLDVSQFLKSMRD